MMTKHFRLVHGSEEMGTLSFNGKTFVFTLGENVREEDWERMGIIPIQKNRKYESPDLFFYVNARLPFSLRKAPSLEKVKYIAESGLKVASDDFKFVPA